MTAARQESGVAGRPALPTRISIPASASVAVGSGLRRSARQVYVGADNAALGKALAQQLIKAHPTPGSRAAVVAVNRLRKGRVVHA
jgi:hypothetical protein